MSPLAARFPKRIVRLSPSQTLGVLLGGIALSGALQPSGSTLLPRAAAQQQERLKAPEFDGAGDWLNTDKPLTLQQLKGKIVVLDFWTLC